MHSITIEEIRLAFIKLKSHVYHDKTDLGLRISLSKFEELNSSEELFDELLHVINLKSPFRSSKFKKWLGEIDYRIAPKKISSEQSDLGFEPGTYITNIVGHEKYNVAKVNYFFSGPIQLHLIAVLWIMREGKFLDAALGTECYGARLDRSIHKEKPSKKIYKKYHELYKRWRDLGMQKAEQMLVSENKSVCILGLDIQEYYYHIDLDYDEILAEAQRAGYISYEISDNDFFLTRCLEKIAEIYRSKISDDLAKTHENDQLPTGLPIGLLSSPLIANWYLRKLDISIRERIRPAYYGRYVDDILIVIESPGNINFLNRPVDALMEGLFIESKVLLEVKNKKYELSEPRGLFLQQEKCILQQFDPRYSTAGLRKFKKKIEENASNFLLLPVEEIDISLEDASYDLIYDGSTNKFRSVKGVSGNRYELAKQLAKQTVLHLFTDDDVDSRFTSGILNFFKGKSVIEFSDLWERVVTLFLVAQDESGLKRFSLQIKREIEKIEFKSDIDIAKKIKSSLIKNFELSISMARALTKSYDEMELLEDADAMLFRSSNMIRHHFIRTPLLNFTQFRGPLTAGDVPALVKLSRKAINNSPRFVNFDECLMVTSIGIVDFKVKYQTRKGQYNLAKRIFKSINGKSFKGAEWATRRSDDEI